MLRHAFTLIAALILPLLSSAQCSTTVAPAPPFVPPAPYWSTPPNGMFWYGSNTLWTSLSVDGKWTINKSESYFNKLIFWRQGFDWHKEPEPKLTITARRLDGDAPPVTVQHA